MVVLDALVVGAGPGGASAAYHLARGGAKVALVDSGELGGERPAGGFCSALAQDCLDGMRLGEWAAGHQRCREMRFVGPRGTVASWQPGSRASLIIPRAELESVLLRACSSAGVRLYPDTRVRGIEVGSDSVVARSSGPSLPAACLVILAEGSRPDLAASLGLVRRDPDFVSMHTLFEYDSNGVAEIHYLPDLLPSVAWALPAGPGLMDLSVSALSRGAKGYELLAGLRQLSDRRAFDGALAGRRPLRSPRVRFLRSGLNSVVPYGERVLLAGDAAGVVHPLTLEGIGAAMESGRVAAQHGLYALEKGRFSGADLSAYAKALQRSFGVEYRAARFLRELLRSERVLERILGRAQRDRNFASMIGNLFMRSQSTLGTLTPANLARYLMWWRTPRRR
ncbi:MAG: NAD(P)/FAD-dependent oxidoreductase [Anaerolineae bacterium]|nr:NAD(P)/FAD-dependent oxidoreductase [Anaerolineae bacterium]